MAAEIKVGVGADVAPFQKGLKQAEGSVQTFEKSLGELEASLKRSKEALKEATSADSIVGINKAIAATEQRIKTIKSLSDTSVRAGGEIVKANKSIGVSFMGTARVLQDAAFGPGAIANNLEGLGNDFKQLSQQAKDSGQSIGKTLIQSLMGGGGLNLALSGLTLGLSLASFGMSAWTRAFGENKKAVDSTKKSTEEYINSLSQVEQSRLKGSQNAQEELAALRVLYSAYQDANLPLSERKEAYKQLQEKYPAYFENLKFEAKATKKTKDAYDDLTGAILATAKARAAESLIAKNAETQLLNSEKILSIGKDLQPVLKEELRLRQEAAKVKGQFDEFGQSREGNILERANDQRSKANELLAKSNALKVENQKLDEANLRLVAEAEKNIVHPLKEPPKTTNKEDKKISFLNLDSLYKVQEEIRRSNVFKLPELDTSSLQRANDQIENHRKEMKARFQLWGKDYEEFNNKLNAQNEILKQGFQSAFEGIGEAIGNAFANGEDPLKAAGAAILGTLGDVLVQFGKLTIKAGIAATALAYALSNPLNPGAGAIAIAAGIALVAIGSAVKSFSGGLAKSGSSGGSASSGGSFTPSVPSGFSPSAPGGQAATPRSDVITVQGILKGQDILLSSQRTQALNFRTGGAI